MWSKEDDTKQRSSSWSSTAGWAAAAIGVGATAAIVSANMAVGPQADTYEGIKLLGNLSRGSAINSSAAVENVSKDGLVWCKERGLELRNVKNYVREMKKMFVDLTRNSPDTGLVPGNDEDGFGRGLNENRKMHVFWAYGVGSHATVHTSLAILYRSVMDTNKFVMLKIDLQTADGDVGCGKDGDIYILHEVKVVDGINRNIWSEEERLVEISLTALFGIIQERIQGMERGYKLFRNNCIRFKNDLLKALMAVKTIEETVPDREEVTEMSLRGNTCVKYWI